MIQSLLRCVIGVWRLDDCTNANYGLLRISSIDCYRYKNNYTPLAASSMQLSFRGVRIVFACVRPLTLQKQSLRPRCHCGYHCEAMSPESVSVGALASLSGAVVGVGVGVCSALAGCATFGSVFGLRGCRVLIVMLSVGSLLRALRSGTLCALLGDAGFHQRVDCVTCRLTSWAKAG